MLLARKVGRVVEDGPSVVRNRLLVNATSVGVKQLVWRRSLGSSAVPGQAARNYSQVSLLYRNGSRSVVGISQRRKEGIRREEGGGKNEGPRKDRRMG